MPHASPPFEPGRLDALLRAAEIDVLVATSKHNVQYLGAFRSEFFSSADAVGTARALPIFVYPTGDPDGAALFCHRFDRHDLQVQDPWPPHTDATSSGTVDAMDAAFAFLSRRGVPARIGVEPAFLPYDAARILLSRGPQVQLVDATRALERLRAVKTPRELTLLRLATEGVVDAMLEVFQSQGAGATKREIVAAFQQAVVRRGLAFDYCLIAMGDSLNRARSSQAWRRGDVLSLDSGVSLDGYIGDVARMACLGPADAELLELLAVVDSVQQAAIAQIAPGAIGRSIFAAAEGALSRLPSRGAMHFVAHGMGLVTHESPRLTDTGPVRYPADDADLPLAAGMVLSIETTLQHPRRGFIKLEDTVAVTDRGREVFGDTGRYWNHAG